MATTGGLATRSLMFGGSCRTSRFSSSIVFFVSVGMNLNLHFNFLLSDCKMFWSLIGSFSELIWHRDWNMESGKMTFKELDQSDDGLRVTILLLTAYQSEHQLFLQAYGQKLQMIFHMLVLFLFHFSSLIFCLIIHCSFWHFSVIVLS